MPGNLFTTNANKRPAVQSRATSSFVLPGHDPIGSPGTGSLRACRCGPTAIRLQARVEPSGPCRALLPAAVRKSMNVSRESSSDRFCRVASRRLDGSHRCEEEFDLVGDGWPPEPTSHGKDRSSTLRLRLTSGRTGRRRPASCAETSRRPAAAGDGKAVRANHPRSCRPPGSSRVTTGHRAPGQMAQPRNRFVSVDTSRHGAGPGTRRTR